MTEVAELATDQLTALVDEGQRQKLRMLLNDQHPADLAEWLSEMDPPHRLSCFRLLDLDNASAVLAELEQDQQRELLKNLGDIGVVPIVTRMSPDDAADLLAELPTEKAKSIISQMTDLEQAEDIEELLTFKEDSAGGIMSTDYLALNAKMSVEEALAYLREKYEDLEEEIYDVYVVDEQEHLVGCVTLRELLTAEPEGLVESIMDDNVIKVTTNIDQEQAAEKLSRYDLLSIAVVDERGVLRGIITADDVIDVLHEEATEDIYQSSGISTGTEDTELIHNSVRSAFAARLPWLMVTLMIESGSASVIKHFDFVIQQTIAAASFMPLLSGVTGSVATQSTCIIIRSGTPGQIDWKSARQSLFHEIKVGMLLGLTCGIFTGIISVVLHNTKHNLGLVVGCSLFLTMTAGVTIGTLMPMLFQKIGVDPAHASGPFITSVLDVCTMSIYLSIVYTFLEHLV